MTRKIICSAYLRVSTLNHGQDTNLQLHSIKELAKQRGYILPDELIFTDSGISGATESRPQLDKLIGAAKQGKFSVLIIFDVTRLGRNTKHLVNTIDLFRKLNVRPIFIKEAIDFTNESTSILLFEILAVLSSFERRLIGERVKVALRIKKAIAEQTGNGWTTGRPPLEDDVKSKVIELYQQGLSIRKISQQLGSISKSSVQRLIKHYKSSDPKL